VNGLGLFVRSRKKQKKQEKEKQGQAVLFPLLLGALWCLAPMQLRAADEGCPDLKGKSTAAHLEYLRGDRSKLAPKCIMAAITYVGIERYAEASAVLIQDLDYQDPSSKGQVGKRASIIYAYPAIEALYGLGKPVVPELIAVISEANTVELVRQNAAEAIALIYGASRPDAIGALVSAAHAQTDPIASNHLMDQARWLAARCIPAARNECENAVLK
jgi:hypothetical protein